MAAKAYARASELYRSALTKAPTPAAPIRVSCYWPSKAAVRQPWTRTPDWRCQAPTHQSVTAALARLAPQDARLLSYTCDPAERNGLRPCRAKLVSDRPGAKQTPEVFAFEIGGTPLAQTAEVRRYDLTSY